ncbi:Eukaryotic/viral aspartic protease, partial [Phytophthora megakarya]
RSVSFEDTEFDHDAKDEDDYVDDELEDKAPVQEPDLHDDADVFVTKRGDVKSLSRNLADEFEEADKPEPAHDDIDDLNDDSRRESTHDEEGILDMSSWIQLFAPKAARQAVWAELVEERLWRFSDL